MVGRLSHDVGRVAVLLSLVALLVGAAVGPAIGTVGGVPAGANNTDTTVASRSDSDTIHRTLSLSLTPERPGEIAVTATFDIPESVRSLESMIPPDATVTTARGFSKQSALTYAWDGTTAKPFVRFVVPANETASGVRAAERLGHDRTSASQGQNNVASASQGRSNVASASQGRSNVASASQRGAYSFVDTGSWALVAVPQLSTRWQYVGDPVTLEKAVRVDGQGATGNEIAFLGAHRTVERTAHGQHFTFVVPAAADLEVPASDILDSTAAASDTLRVGDRDEHVFLVAAPASVEWAAAGIEFGGNDYWVKANERLSDPRNVWLHEYVHTRQRYDPASGTRWTTEAGAEYYAALLTYQQDRISFAAFRRHLERGTRDPVASAVLAEPSTWPPGTPYLKGSLVYGNVDRQIRLDSNQTRSMQAVLSRMNADTGQVTASELYSFVASAGTANTRSYAERYAGTSAVPSTWTASEHEAAFGSLPARVGYRTLDIHLTGVTNQTLTGDTVVTTGATIVATVEVTNTGGANSTYETSMFLDDRAVSTASGSIAAEKSKTVTLSHTIDQAGTYTLSVGGTTRTLVVQPPAQPQVSELRVNASSEDGDWHASISVTLTNPSDRQASGTVPVTIDGRTVTTLDVTLPANASTTRTVTTRIDPGSHTITAGSVSTTIDVPAAPPSTPIMTPGFGVTVTGIALLLALLASTTYR